jgi:hypothetical protein
VRQFPIRDYKSYPQAESLGTSALVKIYAKLWLKDIIPKCRDYIKTTKYDEDKNLELYIKEIFGNIWVVINPLNIYNKNGFSNQNLVNVKLRRVRYVSKIVSILYK